MAGLARRQPALGMSRGWHRLGEARCLEAITFNHLYRRR
jgi:hypothetical protein